MTKRAYTAAEGSRKTRIVAIRRKSRRWRPASRAPVTGLVAAKVRIAISAKSAARRVGVPRSRLQARTLGGQLLRRGGFDHLGDIFGRGRAGHQGLDRVVDG